MKYLLSLLFYICTAATSYSQVKLSHLTSFATSWLNGALSGVANNVGLSSVNVSLNISKSGGSYAQANGSSGSQTPTVAGSIMDVAGSVSNMQLTMDFTTNTQYADIVYSFSGNVTGVSFRIADIDKSTSTSSTYFDRVTVTGSNGSTTFNPTITKYDNSSSVIIISGNTARANTNSGSGGNSASSLFDQDGTVNVSFGTNVINSVTIRYDNAPGAQSNPAAQAISIGDISFSSSATLPVIFNWFTAENEAKSAKLAWSTSGETNVSHFVVERSIDGSRFDSIVALSPQGGNGLAQQYQYLDGFASHQIVFYRICEVDIDGTKHYSAIRKVEIAPGYFTGLQLQGNTVVVGAPPDRKKLLLRFFSTDGKLMFSQTLINQEGRSYIFVPLERGKVYIAQLTGGNNFIVAKKVSL